MFGANNKEMKDKVLALPEFIERQTEEYITQWNKFSDKTMLGMPQNYKQNT